MSRYWQRPWSHSSDNMRVNDPLCPWCGNPDKRPKGFKNESHEAKRLLRRGKVRIVKKPMGWPAGMSITRTVCAHRCHSA